jgi:hypothetical protein
VSIVVGFVLAIVVLAGVILGSTVLDNIVLVTAGLGLIVLVTAGIVTTLLVEIKVVLRQLLTTAIKINKSIIKKKWSFLNTYIFPRDSKVTSNKILHFCDSSASFMANHLKLNQRVAPSVDLRPLE